MKCTINAFLRFYDLHSFKFTWSRAILSIRTNTIRYLTIKTFVSSFKFCFTCTAARSTISPVRTHEFRCWASKHTWQPIRANILILLTKWNTSFDDHHFLLISITQCYTIFSIRTYELILWTAWYATSLAWVNKFGFSTRSTLPSGFIYKLISLTIIGAWFSIWFNVFVLRATTHTKSCIRTNKLRRWANSYTQTLIKFS